MLLTAVVLGCVCFRGVSAGCLVACTTCQQVSPYHITSTDWYCCMVYVETSTSIMLSMQSQPGQHKAEATALCVHKDRVKQTVQRLHNILQGDAWPAWRVMSMAHDNR